MTDKEVERRIAAIARKSSKFKIGETGLKENERLSLHSGYRRIESITWSKNPESIDKLEAKMIDKFFNWKNNDNDKRGSAGQMKKGSDMYILYVVFTLKRKS